VRTSGRDLQRPLGVRLALHLGEIDVSPRPIVEQPGDIHVRRRQLALLVQEIGQLGQAGGPQDAQPGDDTRLGEILPGQDERFGPGCARREGHRQRPAHRPDRPLEPQLAQDYDLRQAL
jgi:hypothetical protein